MEEVLGEKKKKKCQQINDIFRIDKINKNWIGLMKIKKLWSYWELNPGPRAC